MKADLSPSLLDDFLSCPEEVSLNGGVELGESDVSRKSERSDEEGLDVGHEFERERETTKVGLGKGYREEKGLVDQPGLSDLWKGGEMDEPSRRRLSAFSVRIVCLRTSRSCPPKRGLDQPKKDLVI